MSDSLQPHESQQARPHCPSSTLRVHSNSCPLSRWCHPAISYFVIPFSSCPQPLPASAHYYTKPGTVPNCLAENCQSLSLSNSNEIKRCLLLGRKVMINLNSIFKSRDITLPTKVHLVKDMFFSVACMDVRVGRWRKLSAKELMLLNCGVEEDSWESLGLQGDPTSPF